MDILALKMVKSLMPSVRRQRTPLRRQRTPLRRLRMPRQVHEINIFLNFFFLNFFHSTLAAPQLTLVSRMYLKILSNSLLRRRRASIQQFGGCHLKITMQKSECYSEVKHVRLEANFGSFELLNVYCKMLFI